MYQRITFFLFLSCFLYIKNNELIKLYTLDHNRCQKSWNTCIISAAHFVVSPLPLKTMLLYTVLKGTERVAMLADTSLTNKHLIQYFFRAEGISIVRHG